MDPTLFDICDLEKKILKSLLANLCRRHKASGKSQRMLMAAQPYVKFRHNQIICISIKPNVKFHI